MTQPDYTSHCLSTMNAGAEIFIVSMEGNSVHRVARSCDSVGFHPIYDTIVSALRVDPLLTVAAILYAIHLWRRDESAVPLLIVIGGGTAALIEPIVDVNGGCWWPRHGGWTAFHLFGTPVPVWAVACYFRFVGGHASLAPRYLKRNPSRQTIGKLCAAVATVNFLLETPGLSLHLYRYWGHQPLNPYGWPLWWAAVNVGLPLVGDHREPAQPCISGPRCPVVTTDIELLPKHSVWRRRPTGHCTVHKPQPGTPRPG